jgi:glycosyltransferase involved in cell wall biosynthesis
VQQYPLASIIIPSYNTAAFLPQTLNSILSQEYSNIEILVIDDGSTDNTRDVIRPYLRNGVRYIYQENSGGPARPRNTGIQNAAGRYIFLFDGDDLMLPSKIARSVEFLEQGYSVGLLFTNFMQLDEDGRSAPGTFLDSYYGFQKLPKKPVGKEMFIISQEAAYAGLVFENFIGTSSTVFPRAVFDRIGLFDESLRYSEDRDLWLRVARHYDIAYLNVIGHGYRVRAGSISHRDPLINAPDRIRVLRKQLQYALPQPLHKEIRRWIASNYMSLGWRHQHAGQMKLARRNYVLGLREYFSWPLLRGVLITLLGHRLVSFLRQQRRGRP